MADASTLSPAVSEIDGLGLYGEERPRQLFPWDTPRGGGGASSSGLLGSNEFATSSQAAGAIYKLNKTFEEFKARGKDRDVSLGKVIHAQRE